MRHKASPQADKLLGLLKDHPEGMTRQQLIDALYGGWCNHQTFDLLVHRLRVKLGEERIVLEKVYRYQGVD